MQMLKRGPSARVHGSAAGSSAGFQSQIGPCSQVPLPARSPHNFMRDACLHTAKVRAPREHRPIWPWRGS